MKKEDLPKQIKVYAYSGYKANERPSAFLVDGRRCNVNRMIDRWYGEDHDHFKVLTEDGTVCLLKWHRAQDLWLLEKVLEKEGMH